MTSYAAYSLYTYSTSPVTSMAGTIEDDGADVTPFPNLETISGNADPQVEGFVNPVSGTLSTAVTRYTGAGGPGVNIYDVPAQSLIIGPQTWSSVANLFGLVPVGAYLYALDFDNARVVEINPSTFAQTGVSYTLPASLTPSGYVAHGQALIEIGGALYGLFTFADSSWTTYAGSLVVRFTIAGGSSITVGANDHNNGFAGNGFALAVNGADLYVASLGGAQSNTGYNPASRLQSVPYAAANLSAATVTTAMSPSATYPYDFRDITFDGSGAAVILMGSYNSSWNLAGKLLRTSDFVNFTTVDDFSAGVAGYFWSAQYTPAYDRLWYARGSQIRVLDAPTGAAAATLTISSGSLMESPYTSYTDLNDLTYVGSDGSRKTMRGYRSPIQASNSPRGIAARAMAKGRPELTPEELERLESEVPQS